MRAIIVLFAIAVFVACIVWAWPRFEGAAPVLSGPERIELGAAGASIELGWEDSGSGLRNASAILRFGSGEGAQQEIALHDARFQGSAFSGPAAAVGAERKAFDLDAKALGLPDGQATLLLTARDGSWSSFGDGNRSELSIPVIVDTKPPRVSIASGLTYVRRGGAAAVEFRVSADADRSGVRVGEAWFSGFETSDDTRIAIFAIPIEAADDPIVEVVAIDAHANEATARFDVRVQERETVEISIGLSAGFLERIAEPLGAANEMAGSTPVETFQRVNTELRAKSEAVIAAAIGAPSAAQWSGGFEQMRNSKVTSEFAELRHYTNRKQRVSRARHYGFDLASTARAPIMASNGGTVIFADDNGIYGTLVMIDHGLGITTLYGHLSSLQVAVGDRVTKGQELGRSGATGLAGGDHLHFAVLVGRTYADPVEWWDPKWVREHIESRLRNEPPLPG